MVRKYETGAAILTALIVAGVGIGFVTMFTADLWHSIESYNIENN